MLSAFLERAKSTRLTTATKIKTELGVTGATEDAFIASLIDEASALVEMHTNRVFRREHVTEKLSGNGRTLLMVKERLPLHTISEIRFNTDVVDASNYVLHDKDKGFIFRPEGWHPESITTHALGTTLLNMQPEKLFEVDYVGGFLLPGDNLEAVTTIAADSTDNQFTDSAAGFPLLVPGEQFTISGFTDTTINATYTVATRTASVITVSGVVAATEAAGQAIDVVVRNLPFDLERVATDFTKAMFLSRKQNPSITEEKVGDSSIKHGAGSTPDAALGNSPVIKRYRLRF